MEGAGKTGLPLVDIAQPSDGDPELPVRRQSQRGTALVSSVDNVRTSLY